jgi:nitrite reductase/ring-hydroxylating ferredoxin subunit
MLAHFFGRRTWHRVCDAAELEPGTGAVYTVGGREVLLLRSDDGFHALDNTCPHAGAPIGASWFDGETVTCRRHLMRFDVRTGICPDAPSWSAQTYPVRIRDGQVEVGL